MSHLLGLHDCIMINRNITYMGLSPFRSNIPHLQLVSVPLILVQFFYILLAIIFYIFSFFQSITTFTFSRYLFNLWKIVKHALVNGETYFYNENLCLIQIQFNREWWNLVSDLRFITYSTTSINSVLHFFTCSKFSEFLECEFFCIFGTTMN